MLRVTDNARTMRSPSCITLHRCCWSFYTSISLTGSCHLEMATVWRLRGLQQRRLARWAQWSLRWSRNVGCARPKAEPGFDCVHASLVTAFASSIHVARVRVSGCRSSLLRMCPLTTSPTRYDGAATSCATHWTPSHRHWPSVLTIELSATTFTSPTI